eukprot:5244231-Prymnesium_polylepis.2
MSVTPRAHPRALSCSAHTPHTPPTAYAPSPRTAGDVGGAPPRDQSRGGGAGAAQHAADRAAHRAHRLQGAARPHAPLHHARRVQGETALVSMPMSMSMFMFMLMLMSMSIHVCVCHVHVCPCTYMLHATATCTCTRARPHRHSPCERTQDGRAASHSLPALAL